MEILRAKHNLLMTQLNFTKQEINKRQRSIVNGASKLNRGINKTTQKSSQASELMRKKIELYENQIRGLTRVLIVDLVADKKRLLKTLNMNSSERKSYRMRRDITLEEKAEIL